MTENNNNNNTNLQEQEIDLVELARKLWKNRKIIFKSCGWAAVIAIVVGFSIPKEYTTTVTLAPENSLGNQSLSSGLSALAGLAGINMGDVQGPDALSPTIYPDIVKSLPFIVELLDVEITDIKGEMNTTVYEYMKDHQKKAWWRHVLSAPFKAVGWTIKTIKGEKETEVKDAAINPFMLTREQSGIIGALGKKIDVEEDKKTSLIKISVTMQDPLISAMLTDTVMVKLQEYITEYRTNKARKDLEFTQRLYDESMQNYHKLQQEYAKYVDRNQQMTLMSAKTQMERMKDEMQLAYSVYSQTAQQLQVAKAKVQEYTPVYTVVETPTVPLSHSKPQKALIFIGFVFLAALGASGWILFGKDFKDSIKE